MKLLRDRQDTPTTPAPSRRAAPASRQRGSLLILCVTVLVIIALVGIAFLQRVRLDQMATARHKREYIDLVINGILAEIGTQMSKDVFENMSDGQELYDYPWTNDSVQQIDAVSEFNNNAFERVNGSGTLFGTRYESNHEDDRWLASSTPVYNSSTNKYHWLHLSNLTGFWVDPEATTEASLELPIDGGKGNIYRSDTDIQIYDSSPATPTLSTTFNGARSEPLGVDTDLDGIFDARWQWAPISVRTFSGRRYIVALRIVDLNSMLNVNTATFGTIINDSTQNMRGWAPTGVDLSRLLRRVDYNDTRLINNSGFPGQWANEMRDMLDTRTLQGSTAALFPSNYGFPFTPRENMIVWEEQASIYGNLDRNYLADSELDLRKLGGVNDMSTETPLEVDLPRLLRQHPDFERYRGTEASYVDLVGTAGTTEARMSRWFFGADPGSPTERDTNSRPVVNREFPAIRHMLTALSGVGAYVTDYGNRVGTEKVLKFDLKQEWRNEAELRQRIEQAFKIAQTAAPGDNNYLGLSDIVLGQLISEYVTAIQDYSDADSIPRESSFLLDHFGLERLPFLREAYFHVLYEDEDLNPPADNQYDTWVAKNGTQAVVIELGNPFPHDLRGNTDSTPGADDKLNGRIKVVIKQGPAKVGEWVFNDPSSISFRARDDSDQEDTLLIVSNPTDQASTNGSGEGPDLENDLNLSGNILTTANGELSFNADGSDITVELQVDVAPAGSAVPDWVVYDRMETNFSFDADIPHGASNIDPAVAAGPQHAQRTFQRNSEEINYISIDTGDGTGSVLPEDPPSSPSPFDANLPDFRDDNKAHVGASTPLPAGFQLCIANQEMRSIAELAWVHMFGFSRTEPFSERVLDPALDTPGQHFLLIDPTDAQYKSLSSPPNSAGIPHAAILMDLMTTISPRNDNVDNDNDDGDNDPDTSLTPIPPATDASIDNDTEQFIPGMINVNTAPLHILTLGAALAENNVDEIEALMRLIIAYRDQPVRVGYNDPATGYNDADVRNIVYSQSEVDRRTKPGIASVGELMYMNLNNTGGQPFNMLRYGNDLDPSLPSNLDLYPDPDETGTSTINEGDRSNEQWLARFAMLSQSLTTRSDRFVVYAVVRGYEWSPEDTTLNGQSMEDMGLVETAQFIAIFDRGSLDTATDSPKIIGFIRLQ